MPLETTIPAKATNPDNQSDGIVVSFGAEWHQHLLSKNFSVVIRKRVPKKRSFRWLYFHIKTPVSAICGRATIEKIFTATAKEALALAQQINLTPAEITSYMGGDSILGCYKIGSIQIGVEPVSSQTLASRLIYHPPQSFFIISKQAKAIIDQLAGFSNPKASRATKILKT